MKNAKVPPTTRRPRGPAKDRIIRFHKALRAGFARAFPPPDTHRATRAAAVTIILITVVQLGRVAWEEQKVTRRLPARPDCRIWVQVGGVRGPVACADRGVKKLKAAGLHRCCIRQLDRRARPQALRSGDRLSCEQTSTGCRLLRRRMSPPYLRTLNIAVDLNRASATELQSLPGIGPRLARRIARFRNRHGPFRQVNGLLRIRGVGPRLLKKIEGRLYVTLGGER